MARLPRLVIPGIPYHVTQRGNRRQPTFFEEGDYAIYRDLLGEAATKAGTAIWCYCLMPNHVHIIAVPADENGLARAFADAHRRYTGFVNARARWTGHLWQSRFGAVAMDKAHLAHAARYVSLNPVRARPEDWRWSSVRAHLAGKDDELVQIAPFGERYGEFGAFLGDVDDQRQDIAWRTLRMSETTGRPIGTDDWLVDLETRTGRTLRPRKRGPKPKEKLFSKVAP